MKRTVIIATALIFSAGFSLAGINPFGLKAGLNFSSLPEIQTGTTPQYVVSALSDSYTGFHVGVFGVFVFRGWFLQPELLYTQTGRDMRLEFPGAEQDDEYFVQKYSHVVLPLHAGAKFGPLKVSAAPVFSFLINSWNDLTQQTLEWDLSKLTLGYQLGAGLQLGKLLLDFRYESNFTNFGEDLTIGGQTVAFDTRPKQFILGLGFKF